MLARLGQVIYWAAGGLAILLLVGAGSSVFLAEGGDRLAAVAVFASAAVLIWLAGRACLYVLAGK